MNAEKVLKAKLRQMEKLAEEDVPGHEYYRTTHNHIKQCLEQLDNEEPEGWLKDWIEE